MNNHNKLFIKSIVLGILLFSGYCFSQLKTISFEELPSLQQKDPRIVVIFVHTDWCSYCKAMLKTTFQDKQVVELLNNKYYFIDFDAESKKDIVFLGKTFKYKELEKDRGFNELSDYLSYDDDKEMYPRTIFLNAKNEMFYKLDGFINKQKFRQTLEIILAQK